MLVLQRKQAESIVIGDDVVIHFVRIARNKVTIAIDAPREVTIRRGELCRWSMEPPPTCPSPETLDEGNRGALDQRRAS